MTNPQAGTPQVSREHPLFKAGAFLLIVANIICGLFAFFAEQGIGNKHADFAVSFTFLGLVFIGIFVLASIDLRTRTEHPDWEYHH